MKEPFNFVWVLGSGSKWQDNEIRYSIRSVLKFHPDANILIIGERPKWFRGLRHTFVPDASDCPYVNQWHKLEKACELFEEFIYMDDDFYLLRQFVPYHYRKGSLDDFRIRGSQKWREVVRATKDTLPGTDRHLLHVPLPIISHNFKMIAKHYPQRHEAPSLVPRQVYCHHETDFEVRDLPRDVKTVQFGPVRHMPFFSTKDNMRRIKHVFEELYPKPSVYEGDRHQGRKNADFRIQSAEGGRA